MRAQINKYTAFFMFFVFFLPSLSIAAQDRTIKRRKERIALIIGNGAYRVSPLKNPVNDARDTATVLTKLGFSVTLKENASKRTMERAIRELGKVLRKGGVGLFYFAGHGVQVEGINYLIPVGANIELEADVEYEAVNVGRILSYMEDAGNSMNIIILDACRNNPFRRSFRSVKNGLAKMDAPIGSILAYSTSPGSVAADGTRKNGLYTSKLLKHMITPNLKIEDVFEQVRIDVVRESERRQIPWESTSLMGDFYFNPNKISTVVAHSTSAPINQPTETGPSTGRIFIETEPQDASIRILNIVPKYRQGMSLGPGRYHIEVSKSDFETKKIWTILAAGEEKILKIQLVSKPERQSVNKTSNTWTTNKLKNTTWKGIHNNESFVIEFNENGSLSYYYPKSTGRFVNGKWWIDGTAIYMVGEYDGEEKNEIGSKVSASGSISGNTMICTTYWIGSRSWDWTAKKNKSVNVSPITWTTNKLENTIWRGIHSNEPFVIELNENGSLSYYYPKSTSRFVNGEWWINGTAIYMVGEYDGEEKDEIGSKVSASGIIRGNVITGATEWIGERMWEWTAILQ